MNHKIFLTCLFSFAIFGCSKEIKTEISKKSDQNSFQTSKPTSKSLVPEVILPKDIFELEKVSVGPRDGAKLVYQMWEWVELLGSDKLPEWWKKDLPRKKEIKESLLKLQFDRFVGDEKEHLEGCKKMIIKYLDNETGFGLANHAKGLTPMFCVAFAVFNINGIKAVEEGYPHLKDSIDTELKIASIAIESLGWNVDLKSVGNASPEVKLFCSYYVIVYTFGFDEKRYWGYRAYLLTLDPQGIPNLKNREIFVEAYKRLRSCQKNDSWSWGPAMVSVINIRRHFGFTAKMVEEAGWKQLASMVDSMEEYDSKKIK